MCKNWSGRIDHNVASIIAKIAADRCSPGIAKCARYLMEGLKYFVYFRNALFLHAHQIFGYLNHECILHLNQVSNSIHTPSGPLLFVKH